MYIIPYDCLRLVRENQMGFVLIEYMFVRHKDQEKGIAWKRISSRDQCILTLISISTCRTRDTETMIKHEVETITTGK